jgi:hypothetical protein
MTPQARLRMRHAGMCLRAAPGMLTVLALMAAGAMLPACSSTPGEMLPHAMGGLPANAPERPAAPGQFPAVHDMPPARANTVLSDEERRKAEQELLKARDLQPGRAKAKATPSKGKERAGAPRSP